MLSLYASVYINQMECCLSNCHKVLYKVGEPHLGFQDVVFLPPIQRQLFHHIFFYCCRGESLVSTTCLRTVVFGKHGHAPCNDHFAPTNPLLCQSNFMEIIRLLRRLGKVWPPLVLGILLDFSPWYLSVYTGLHGTSTAILLDFSPWYLSVYTGLHSTSTAILLDFRPDWSHPLVGQPQIER